MKILVVDDKEENLYMLDSLLSGSGYEVVNANNGAVALDILENEKVDLIISDILMPVMDGFTFCRKCKANELSKKIPFIFYTATYTDKKDEEFALDLGADKFLLKPQDPDVFIEIVKSLLEEVKQDRIIPKKPPQVPEETLLKEYNASLIRKLEDKMQETEEKEKELQKYVKDLENTVNKCLKVERELKESEERFRLILENSLDAIFLTAPDGSILSANRAACDMFEMTEEEIIEMKREGIVDKTDPRLTKFLKERELNGKARSEINLVKKGNKKFPSEVSSSVFINQKGEKRTTLIVRDITERKKAHEQIMLLAHSIKSIGECVSITDTNDNLIFVNNAFLQTYGYKENEIIGKNIKVIRPESSQVKRNFKNILPKTLEGGWEGEIVNVKKDGTHFPIYLSTSVVKDDNNKPIALIGVAKDITEEKSRREELVRAKDEAEKSSRLKTEFLAQMSHEIRSPLNAILNFSTVIREEVKCEEDETLKIAFSAIDSASKRVIRTVDSILNMSELQLGTYQVSIEKCDLKSMLENLVREFMSTAENKKLKLNFNTELSKADLSTDDYAVKQIFANLIDNAIKYTNTGSVDVSLLKSEDSSFTIKISDTGIGISKEFKPYLFDAFRQEEQGYTRTFEGSGLGLSLTSKYCQLIDAKIEVESEKNIGTTFTVQLRSMNKNPN